MSGLLNGFLSDRAGSLLQSWNENQARQQWGLFEIHGEAQTNMSFTQGLFNEPLKTFKNSLTGDSSQLFPGATIEKKIVTVAHNTTDAPQEDGTLLSYNKVRKPMEATLSYLCDGSLAAGGDLTLGSGVLAQMLQVPDLFGNFGQDRRNAFLKELDKLAGNTEMYLLKMPEFSWPRVNITGYKITRGIETVGMLAVDVNVKEVRYAPKADQPKTTTAQPQGAKPRAQGTVQPKART